MGSSAHASSTEIQPSVHAIGGRAIEQALRGDRAGDDRSRVDRSTAPRIDHFGEPTRDQMARAADSVSPSPQQPPFAYVRGAPGEVYERRLGALRVARTYPFRWLVDAGIRFGAGSDSPVVPNNPLLGIHGLVNGHHESQRLTAREALAAYTTEAAWVDREEDVKGSSERATPPTSRSSTRTSSRRPPTGSRKPRCF